MDVDQIISPDSIQMDYTCDYSHRFFLSCDLHYDPKDIVNKMGCESRVKEQAYLIREESHMEPLMSTQLSVPLSHILALLSLTTLILIFGYTRMALLLNYSFLMYWSYLSNVILFTEKGELQLNRITLLYMAFGFAILLLATMGLIHNRE